MKTHQKIATALAVLALAATTQAGPPFVTDDPEPVDLHHWELYLGAHVEHDPSFYSGTLPHVEVNYGAAPNLQLHLILPCSFVRTSGGGFDLGYGDTEWGVKYRLLSQSAGRPSIGIFPLVELPTGNNDRGLGSGHVQVFLPVWIQKDWNQWTSYGGGGYFFGTRDRSANYWLAGWEIQRDLGEQLMLGGELFVNVPSEAGAGTAINFNLGGQVNINDQNHVLFSGGRGLKGDVQFMAYLAYQWTFGPK